MENQPKKKIPKKKKKFFIILACYVLTFVLTAVITASTLSWYSGSTWQTETLYMGGPVYIYFSDDSGVTQTSGTGKLVTETPPGWTRLYPGMNINFEAKAVIQGKEFEKIIGDGSTIVYPTTEAVLRAKVTLKITDAYGSSTSLVATQLYDWIWPQLKYEALADTSNPGVWIFDQINDDVLESNYFYYCVKDQTAVLAEDYYLQAVGGVKDNVTVGFLNNAVIQLPSIDLTNEHADCIVKFTIVFEAVQAFFPYEQDDLGTPYQGDTTGRSEVVIPADLGLEKPLTICNGRQIFNESMFTPENGYPEASE